MQERGQGGGGTEEEWEGGRGVDIGGPTTAGHGTYLRKRGVGDKTAPRGPETQMQSKRAPLGCGMRQSSSLETTRGMFNANWCLSVRSRSPGTGAMVIRGQEAKRLLKHLLWAGGGGFSQHPPPLWRALGGMSLWRISPAPQAWA